MTDEVVGLRGLLESEGRARRMAEKALMALIEEA